ncbi:glycoside hydrolase family 3 N-terminal domain-containing protein [Paenibacillus sp. LHD-38]|uniref:glycoside hydrolase family 3 N-terminal domain-containing protein n=1 Tax=Paenibacillus sp. LHD-38 TaxID=3072143 RepID=UPI00280DD704|nr:glycoside hydrolase family 3 N-terminal domain-containing protein [Paenibacillus sp. LHD-38]MDQ8736499.1 glycoside hydrolase family 3 N-terminal domain-containing protein [Paenibacillus sp. LHD-38]
MNEDSIRYLNPALSAEERADDLLRRMSLEEKMGQIVGYLPIKDSLEQLENDNPQGVGEVSMLFAGMSGDKDVVVEKVTRIQKKIMELSEHHIPALFHMETLTGAMIPGATSFPSGIGQGSTWNPQLHKKMAVIASRQARAVGASHAFAPVLDISRDSRFGRQGEAYGEDPALASAMATAYVSGLQNDGELNEGVLACAKHFVGYHAAQGGIHAASTSIPPRLLREIYAKPFQAAITNANMKSIMNTYSSIDGEAVAGSSSMLTDLLRGEMGFDGLTVSDYTSILEQHTRLKVSASKTEAGERSLRAGMDVELPSKECYNDELMMRIKNGIVEMEVLDRAVRNVLIAKFELGLFENPFAKSKEEIELIYTDRNNERIGLEMARQSLILMKNNGVLPLKRAKQKIAVIGHHASSTRSLFGGYSFATLAENMLGTGNTMAGVDFEEISNLSLDEFGAGRDHFTYPGSQVKVELSAVEGQMKKYYPGVNNLLEQIMLACPEAEVTYSYGYAYAGSDASKHEEALAVAAKADLVVLTLGGKHGWGMSATTGEGVDSTSIQLPECQESFIKKLADLNKPTVAVHFDGRPISSDMTDQHIDAIIEAWNPGQYGAIAITDVLFGDYNPAGRLPVSVAYNAGQIPIFYNHDNGSSYNVGTSSDLNGYVDCPREPRYYFGHGLSYTTFAYSNLRISQAEYEPNEQLRVYVDITNTGEVFGEEVVQLYIRDSYASMVRPVKELAGFVRVPLGPMEKKTIAFTMELSQFAFLDADMKWKIESGEMGVMVGASSQDVRASGNFSIASDLFIDGKTRGFYAEVEVLIDKE